MRPIVLIDFRVFGWGIYNKTKDLVENSLVSEDNLQKLIKCLWAYYINRGPIFMEPFDHRVIIVSDEKDEDGDYWRTKEMRDDPLIAEAWENWLSGSKRRKAPPSYDYKGNRVGKSDISLVIGIGKKYITENIGKIYTQPGFEADDWAHLVYDLKKNTKDPKLKSRTLYLSTIDRDWSQLVDEDLNIYMANFRKPGAREKFQNRLIDNQGVIEHTEHYTKQTISHPSELAYVKHLKGDSGDNLPPLAPIKYFDLINSHEVYKISEENRMAILQELQSNEVNLQPTHMKKAEEFITLLGFPHYADY